MQRSSATPQPVASTGSATRRSPTFAAAALVACEALAALRFWDAYDALPASVRAQADRSYDLLKRDPHHPSLHLKKVGRFWSVRVGIRYRALAVQAEEGLVWFWIGSHADYDRLIDQA